MSELIYLCGPIGGCTFDECNEWRKRCSDALMPMMTFSPLRPFPNGDAAYGLPGPGVAPWARRFQRDRFDVHTCDGILVNFIGSKRKSIGSAMEIAWAVQRKIPISLAMEPGNVNEDIFLNFFAGPENIHPTLARAVNHLRKAFGHPEYEAE